jgi:hypothetical protein
MRAPRRRPSIAILSATAVAAAAPTAVLAHGDRGGSSKHHDATGTTPALPQTIALPNGFQPEGIAAGPLAQLYAGSTANGSIYRANALTGKGALLVPAHDGRSAMGMKVAGRALIVAGGTTGHAYAYDTRTGKDLADLTLTTGSGQINDVALAPGAAWFTDSRQAQLYRVTVSGNGHGHHGGWGKDDAKGARRGGSGTGDHRGKSGHGASKAATVHFGARHRGGSATTPTPTVATLPITGDFTYDDDPATFEANGIVAANGGRTLLVDQTRTGKLFRIDAKTGVSTEVPLTGGDLANGDGMLLAGRTLYVVKNRSNEIAVVKLAGDLSSGTLERTITSPQFRVPTTIAALGKSLYAVNARFGTPATPDTDYDITRVDAR